MKNWLNKCHFGDVRDVLRQMISDGVKINTIVTSPPYWGLRDYGCDGQLGLEPTIQEFIATMTDVFSLARQVLADDGTAWVNMGDCYATGAGKVNTSPGGGTQGERWAGIRTEERSGFQGKHNYRVGPLTQPNRMPQPGLKPKDMVGQPWRLAFAMQDEGWWLRSDIIWAKPNPMPESCRDRPTKSHEYLFLFAKSERYHFDFEAFQEPATGGAHARRSLASASFPGADQREGDARRRPAGWADEGKHHAVAHNTPKSRASNGVGFGRGYDKEPKPRVKNNSSMDAALSEVPSMRNRRTVWTIPTKSYSGAHFATYPPELVEPCILAGCPVGGTVLDIFFGSGTTGQVAQRLGRNFIGIDINRANEPLQDERLRQPSLDLEAAC
jgi:DNA modification methylase